MLNDGLAAIHMHKTKVRLDRPTYIGMCILESSKHWYYNHLKNGYGNHAQMLSADTDSLIAHLQPDDIYTDMAQNSAIKKMPFRIVASIILIRVLCHMSIRK